MHDLGPVQVTRQRNLRKLIDGRFEGRISLFCEGVSKPSSLISQILAEPSRKSFGERLARDIEAALGLTIGWLDQSDSTVETTELSPVEDLFLLAVARDIRQREVPAHVMQTVLLVLGVCPKRTGIAST